MRRKHIAIINLIVAILVAVFAVGYAFAWLADDYRQEPFKFGGSSGNTYFAGGTGAADDPFLITNKYHLYNFCWLQDTGKFGTTKYYFKLDSDVSVDNTWLPPIGTDDNPFIGEFDGAGHTISNLKITTDTAKLTNPVVSGLSAFSRAVGFFGKTDNKADDNKSYIHNFILKNPLVEVSNASTAPYSDSGNYVAGLAIGSVAGKANSIGILSTEVGLGEQETLLDVQVTVTGDGYSTFNSILGELVAGATSSVTGGGHGGGPSSGNTFGNTFDVETFYSRVSQIGVVKYGIEATLKKTFKAEELKALADARPGARWLPTLSKQGDGWSAGSGDLIPFTVDLSAFSYTDDGAKEIVADTNIGYFLGNQNKIYSQNLTFREPLVQLQSGNWEYSDHTVPSTNSEVPRWLYTSATENLGSNSYTSDIRALTQQEFDALPDGIKELVPSENGTESVELVRLQQTYANSGVLNYGSTTNNQWSYHGKIKWNGTEYGLGRRDSEGFAANEDGYRYAKKDWTGATCDYDNDGEPDVMDADGYVFDSNGYVLDISYKGIIVDDDGYLRDDSSNDYMLDSYGSTLKIDGYGIDSAHKPTYKTGPHAGENVYYMKYGAPQAFSLITADAFAFNSFKAGIALPNCAVWFKPAIAGTARFVTIAREGGESMLLAKCTRGSADSSNPFAVSSASDNNITTELLFYRQMPSFVMFYFEYEVTQEDIDAGNVEFMIMSYNGTNGAYFMYMDMGASSEGELDSSTVDPDFDVTAIDFIYQGVEIAQEASTGIRVGDFIVGNTLYDATKTSIYFEKLSVALEIVYVRKHEDGSQVTMEVRTSAATTEILSTRPARVTIN